MQWMAGAAWKRVWVCFTIVSAGGIAGLVAAGTDPTAAQTTEMTPAQVVAHRFPPAWNNLAPTLAPPVTTVAKQIPSLFDPNPTYALASADSRPAGLPEGALAYADPRVQAMATDSASAAPAAVARQAAPAPERRPPPRPAAHNNDLFNDAQLASIKHRLRLTPDQEHYWPQVAAALRAISYRVSRDAGGKPAQKRLASIDPNSAEVQRLKSAAIPLIMTMREEQKREVRALARLMGLEAVASQI
jgi:hypothetical protein